MENKTGIIQKSLLWSGGAEIAVKLIMPISNMLLARILTPNDFGILAVCNMVISFLDIITDAGFGKYLIQHEFKNEKEKEECANVAFWSNLFLSIFLWSVIVVNRVKIAELFGEKEYPTVISVACIQLIFTSLVSIQLGLLRRDFQFKQLFIARTSVAFVPLVITVPFALITKSYWALIVGNIMGSIVNAVILQLNSNWKPRFFYSFDLLKQMFSFSFWSLCEAVAHWLIFWIDTFIVAQIYTNYYLGLYKNSASMVMSIIGMITAALSPVLLSVLSRIKSAEEFYNIFLHIEKIIMYVLFPMGIGIFFYREFITNILFGKQWSEASDIVGAWALMMVISVVVYSFPAEAYKARGIPKILFLYQMCYLVFLIPICMYTAKIDFWTFVYARTASIFEQAILCIIFIKIFLKWDIKLFLKNLITPSIASLSVVLVCVLCKKVVPDTLGGNFVSIMGIVIIYFVVLCIFFKQDIMKSIMTIQRKKL